MFLEHDYNIFFDIRIKLDLQLQAFAARDIARGFLGHLSNAIATLKFFVLNAFYVSNA